MKPNIFNQNNLGKINLFIIYILFFLLLSGCKTVNSSSDTSDNNNNGTNGDPLLVYFSFRVTCMHNNQISFPVVNVDIYDQNTHTLYFSGITGYNGWFLGAHGLAVHSDQLFRIELSNVTGGCIQYSWDYSYLSTPGMFVLNENDIGTNSTLSGLGNIHIGNCQQTYPEITGCWGS